MQRLGRAAAAVLHAHRCLAAEAAARLQAGALQQELAASLDSRMLASSVQHSKLGSWTARNCQARRQFAATSSSSSSSSSGGSRAPPSAASRPSSALPWRRLPQPLQSRAFSSTGLFTEQPSLPPAAADPAAQDTQQQQARAAGPITGTCRRRNVKCGWKKLDSVLRMIRKSYVDDAMAQLQANPKQAAVFVQHALANARNNAICAGGEAARLWVSEAFVTKGKYQKRLAIMGRGYSSIKQTRFSHLNVSVTQLEEAQAAAAAKLRRRPRTIAPLMVRLQQGQRGRQQQWRRRQLQPQQQQQQQQHQHSQVAAA